MVALGIRNDLTGRLFGRLTVVRFDHREHYPGGTKIFWLCKCSCGAEKVINANRLCMGRSVSCGTCEKPGGNREDWPGYSSLKGAVGRCYNPRNTAYKDYGGRGIGICDRWRFGADGKTGFECFYEDMGPRPLGKTLDRIQVGGDYEPSNCRWATKKQQQQNQRRAIYADIGGVPVPLKKYAARVGLCYETIRFIVRKKGLPVTEAARGVIARAA